MILFVAVAYNAAEDLSGLLGSLQEGRQDGWQLIVANNSAAADGDAIDRALGDDDRATQLRMPGNLGYFGAARAAVDTVDLERFRWVIVLNTDLVIAESFVSRLLELDWRKYGAVAPSIINTHWNSDQNPYMLTEPSRRDLLRRRILLGNPATAQLTILGRIALSMVTRRRHRTPRAFPPDTAMFAPHGSAIVLSRRYFDAGGSLDHPLFLFGEENHVGETCAALGLPVVYRPELQIWHTAHAQTGRLRSWRVLRHMSIASKHYFDAARRNDGDTPRLGLTGRK